MRVQTSKKKKTALNLNVYRNLHHRSLHAQKKKFEELAKKLLRGIPQLGIINLHYEIFVGTKRRLDIMNVGSIIDKYFSDTLTEVGIIQDDDYKNIPMVSFSFGGLVKKEHIRVTITEIKPRKEKPPMRVLLDQSDIQTALTTYVGTLNIPNITGVRLSHNDGEIFAEVLFGLGDDEPTVSENPEEVTEAPKPPRRKRRTKAEIAADKLAKVLEPIAKEEITDVAEVAEDGADNGGTGDASASEVATASDSVEETPTDPKEHSRKNPFGGEESQSSEGDPEPETPLDVPPVPEVAAKPEKQGSIFDG